MELCVCNLKALGAFDYVAATKLATRLIKVYQPLGNLFIKLGSGEGLYTQLSYMKPKWFMRKDSFVLSHYANLTEDITREITVLEASPMLVLPMAKSTLVLLLYSMSEFCQARQRLIAIYQSMAAQSNYTATTSMIKELVSIDIAYKEACIGDTLDLLGTGIEKEISILLSLLRARIAVIDYAFQDACIALFVAKQDIYHWKMLCEEQDYLEKTLLSHEQSRDTLSWRLTLFGNTSDMKQKQGHSWPHTLRWMARYLDNLTAKMTLYFSSLLVPKESLITEEDPEKALWKGLQVDYHDQICTFSRRSNAFSISLVYEVTSTPFYPQGYVCSDTPYEAPQGIHSFPFIYCYPKQPPKDHLPNIISIIQGCHQKLNDPKGSPVYFYDNKITSTYYFMRVDEHVVFVIIYLDRHLHAEPPTSDFMVSVVSSLRGSAVIAELVRMD
ncbi:hypothetical protein BDF14DRAFT_1758571 [Spinellus fusiger]|nr:hypothetical protein BDF14DRAFT_1758571 [Spinellus fusiger]